MSKQNTFVDCTVRDPKGMRQCNFDRQRARPIRVPKGMQHRQGGEKFNSNTFPAKIDHRTQDARKDARYWNIKNDFTHVNMVPSFGSTRGNVQDNGWNSVLEYQTGDFLNREFQKREIEPHFTPYKTNVPNKNWTYNRTRDDNDFGLSQRLKINSYKEGVRPDWSWTQVGPGLNKGYTNCGSEGYHPFWRAPVPTYEELHNKTRPEFDFRNHVIYGRMENFSNGVTRLAKRTKKRQATSWKDNRPKIHTPNTNNKSARHRASIVMNINRKYKPFEHTGDAVGYDGEMRRDADHHQSRQRGNSQNNVGAMNRFAREQGPETNEAGMRAQIIRNLRRKMTGTPVLGMYDNPTHVVGSIDPNIAKFTKDGAIKRRNWFLMNLLRSGNVQFDTKDNNYILPKDLAPGTKKEEILELLRREGAIDTQAGDQYLEPQAPKRTLKEFLIHNRYRAGPDTKASDQYLPPKAPKATIKQKYASQSTRTRTINSRGTSHAIHPKAPRATIKQTLVRPAEPGQVGTRATGHSLLPKAPKATRKQKVVRRGIDTAIPTGAGARKRTSTHGVRAPAATRKDQVAAVGDYVRAGGASEGATHRSRVQSQTYRDQLDQAAGRTAGGSVRGGLQAQQYGNGSTRSVKKLVRRLSQRDLMPVSAARPEQRGLFERVIPINTLNNVRKQISSVNSRLAF